MRQKLLTDGPPSWGQPDCPLVPESLRVRWAELAVPAWLVQEASLPKGSRVSYLGTSVWKDLTALVPRLERYVVNLLEFKRQEILDVPVFVRPLPPDLSLRELPFQARTWNCLYRGRLLDNSHRLNSATFGDLFAIRAMGAKSVLDFSCVVEAAVSWISKVQVDANELSVDLMQEPWLDLVSEEDPRFASQFPPGTGTLLQRLEEATAAEATPIALAALEKSLEAIMAKVKEIEEMPLDLALRDYLSSFEDFDDSRLQALLARLGWGGKAPCTLEEAAGMMGVTRERIRQLQSKIVSRLPSHPVFMPALDAALRIVAEADSKEANALARSLVDKGITTIPFHPLSILSVARACGRATTFSVERVGKGQRVVTSADPDAGYAISVASKKASKIGVANIIDVAADIESVHLIEPNGVREILKSYSDAEFLDEDWFWMPKGKPGRNRLVNVTRRMLAVTQPLHVVTLREGLRRHYPVRGISVVPPKAILARFYEAHPSFEIDHDGRVGSVEPIDYRTELGATERVLIEIFRRSPAGVLDRASLEEACLREGMNLATLGVYSTYSPVLEHLGVDLWALRGVPVDPAAVEAVRRANAQRPREKRIHDYGWSPEGRLQLAVRLPRQPAQGLVVGIPSTIEQYVADRRFSARADDGSVVGTIAVDEQGTSWGYGPYLSRYGADEGDILRIEFDLVTEGAVLTLGGDELMEENS